jgi:hypothetical protein
MRRNRKELRQEVEAAMDGQPRHLSEIRLLYITEEPEAHALARVCRLCIESDELGVCRLCTESDELGFVIDESSPVYGKPVIVYVGGVHRQCAFVLVFRAIHIL